MCGRYTLYSTKRLKDRFNYHDDFDLDDRYNISPGGLNPVITKSNGSNYLQLMFWGLIPSWAKDPKIGYKMINARLETVTEKPSYSRLVKRRRCLVPASGFYEWDEKNKQPYYFQKPDKDIFSFAGLYDHWQDPHGNEIESYTLITKPADDVVSRVHDRMPLILNKDFEDEWLNPDNDFSNTIDKVAKNQNAALECYPVSKIVNRPTVSSAALIEPITLAESH